MTVYCTLSAEADTKSEITEKEEMNVFLVYKQYRNCNKSGLALVVYSIKQMLEGPEQYQLFSSDLQIMTGS